MADDFQAWRESQKAECFAAMREDIAEWLSGI